MNTKSTMTAKGYHFSTIHDRKSMTGHALDWENMPDLYKKYKNVQKIELSQPKPDQIKGISLQEIASEPKKIKSPELNIEIISSILAISNSFTAKKVHMGHTYFYRSPASAGALYPFEIYIEAFSVKGIEPGVYHYSLTDFSLNLIRKYSPSQKEINKNPDAVFYLSSIFFRTSWKYRARGYRYVLLDTGHLLENFLLSLNLYGFSYSVHYDFDDTQVNKKLGLDWKKEACLACVPINTSTNDHNSVIESVESDPLEVHMIHASKVSDREIDYSEIQKIHSAGFPSLDQTVIKKYPLPFLTPKEWCPPEKMALAQHDDFVESVFLRRSRRNFTNVSLEREAFLYLLGLVSKTILKDTETGMSYDPFLTTGFIAENVEGVSPGFYILDPTKNRYGLIEEGRFAGLMASACLDQMWLNMAAVHFLFIIDLEALDTCFGPRGYRYTMLNAGKLGQLLYLGASSIGIGCCGIGAIFDQEAADILMLNGNNTLAYLVALGPVKGGVRR